MSARRGVTVVACWLGGAVLRRWPRHPVPVTLEAFVGVLFLLALRFLPFVGDTAWTLISLIALGASVVVISVSTDLVDAESSR